jgi:hypothetical protein
MSALSMLSGCLVLLAGSGLPLEETTEVEAAVEAEAEPELLAWSDLQRDAARHMGRVRRVIVQFHELQEQWNPFLTRFGPSDYFALGAWSDEQRPWRRAEWEAPAVRAFMQRGTLLAAYLRAGRPHQRFMLTVVVREHCAGRLWAEVLDASRLAEEIPEGTILHAARGLGMIEKHAFELAASEFERALAAPLPDAARRELEELRDQSREAK